MANITHGMNVEQVIAIAGKLKSESGAIGTVISHVDSLLGQSAGVWVGPDQKQFDGLWKTHRPNLVALQNALMELSTKAQKNASAQATESSHL